MKICPSRRLRGGFLLPRVSLAAHPWSDWQRTRNQASDYLVAEFCCSGNHCLWWQLESYADGQEDLDAEKTGACRRDTPKWAMILIVSVRSRRADSCCHHAFFRT
jgi:hypothetical protein